ncbi:MAG: class B sortase [Clostridiales bacterium]|nr:class B sortase [Clostridiales bacterium]
MIKAARVLIITALTAAICVSGYKLCNISGEYLKEAQIKDEMLEYRPQELFIVTENKETPTGLSQQSSIKFDQDIIDLQNEVNTDIVGWLAIPDTRIDYPFVHYEDNDYYLRRDIYGKPATAGTLFMDYRCAQDFSSFNTIIYGHNMKNDSMFGDLKLFADEGFFVSAPEGTVFLKHNAYTLEFFAYMVVQEDDKIIFDASADRGEFFEYIKNTARNYREPPNKVNVVTLSTCSYEFYGARTVLLASIIP